MLKRRASRCHPFVSHLEYLKIGIHKIEGIKNAGIIRLSLAHFPAPIHCGLLVCHVPMTPGSCSLGISRLLIAFARRRNCSPSDRGFFWVDVVLVSGPMTKVEVRACLSSRANLKSRKQISSPVPARLSRRLHVRLLVLLLVGRLIQVKAGEAKVPLRVRMRVYRWVSFNSGKQW